MELRDELELKDVMSLVLLPRRTPTPASRRRCDGWKRRRDAVGGLADDSHGGLGVAAAAKSALWPSDVTASTLLLMTSCR